MVTDLYPKSALSTCGLTVRQEDAPEVRPYVLCSPNMSKFTPGRCRPLVAVRAVKPAWPIGFKKG